MYGFCFLPFSDGLWDVMTYEEAVELVKNIQSPCKVGKS